MSTESRTDHGRNGDGKADPSWNVLDLVDAEGRRQDDLRVAEGRRQDDLRIQAERWQEKLDRERLRADTESKRADAAAKQAEAGRIDALAAAATSNVAIALEKQGAQALAQDKRIAVLEQNQYQAGGRDIQRTEGRQTNQWVIGVVIGIVLAVAAIAGHLVK